MMPSATTNRDINRRSTSGGTAERHRGEEGSGRPRQGTRTTSTNVPGILERLPGSDIRHYELLQRSIGPRKRQPTRRAPAAHHPHQHQARKVFGKGIRQLDFCWRIVDNPDTPPAEFLKVFMQSSLTALRGGGVPNVLRRSS